MIIRAPATKCSLRRIRAPWRVAKSDDKKRARLNIITDLLKQIPYQKTPRPKIELPKRDKAHDYVEYDYSSN
jgi:polyphosphate kinase